MSTTTAAAPRTGARVHVQKFGTFLSNMVLPNIGAFIAWGLITALFIEVGWITLVGDKLFGYPPGVDAGEYSYGFVSALGGWDGEHIGIVGPMITYLLPILIGYTGGRMMYDDNIRGGVVGGIATMGVIAGTEIPMFMGAMIMGPLGGWTMKKVDSLWEGKIRPGFEMLVNNFSAGIWGGILATFGFFVMSPIVTWISDRLGSGVDFLVENNVLPLTSLIIEPAKVLFLNNAINHGVLTPLGTQEVVEQGKSVLFLLEANPGPGLGLLLAYSVFGRGLAKASAPGAAIIHFLGGIHEIYFPYVLMKPKLIVAMIAGGMTGVFINVLFDVGLRAPAAPGSVFAVYAQTVSDSYVGVTLSLLGAAGVSFLVASLLLKTDRADEEGDLAGATASMETMKGKKSLASSVLAGAPAGEGPEIKSIVFACDAGMGSSAMGASVLRRKIHAAGHGDVTVVNKAISNLSDTYDLVVTHQDLTDRARLQSPSAIHVSVDNFMGSPRYDEIVELIDQTDAGVAEPAADEGLEEVLDSQVLSEGSIVLAGTATTRDEAITEAGRLLVDAGAVDASYVDAMHEREKSVSTHMGNLLAIPHGTNEAKGAIQRTAISFVRYPGLIDWNGKPAEFVIGIAGAGNDHLGLLARIAEIFVDSEQVDRLRQAQTPADVLAVLNSVKV
jgi:PTS system mannitol-specific IIC component